MKILFVNNVGTMHGGAEIIIAQLRSGLEKKGHVVRVLAGDESSNGKIIADWHFRSFPNNSILLKFLYIFNPFAVWKLWTILRQFKPDIIHMHNVSKASPFIFLFAKRYPTILTIHDHTVFDPTRFTDIAILKPYKTALAGYFTNTPSFRLYLEKTRFWLYRKFYKSIYLALACSNFYRLCAEQSKLFTRVATLNNGIILQDAKPIRNWQSLLFIGRLEEIKGAHILLKAIPKILSKNPNLHLYIAGSGQEINYIKNLAEELNISNVVQFLGYQSLEQVASLYQKTTLVVVPSLWPENLPTVCIEAMCAGRPIIGSKVGGIPELIDHGKTGFLVDPGNSEQIAEKVIKLFSDKELIKQMSRNARIKSKQFSIEINVNKMENIYLKMIKVAK
jgi:glycosyltransferase involved in cell wall biosynthesis